MLIAMYENVDFIYCKYWLFSIYMKIGNEVITNEVIISN